eukprot:TRINITY_DN48606_c0_g1_i1.p1 TRINITY_DN48606_c0_g1~~TRINITY_DN48606_c0_g1_i1.p1  ORF type:complete len:244 (-),score=37.14 TRINITY_DN48606_c0_g1_i1:204-935(-)
MLGDDHRIWGTAEVLSCYDSSGSASEGSRPRQHVRQGVQRALPHDVEQHMESNVFQENVSSTISDSASEDKLSSRVPQPAEAVRALPDDFESGLPSRGSKAHALGKCKPCLYVNANGGCRKGFDCKFCHVPHAKKTRTRPCKLTRQKCRDVASQLDAFNPNPDQLLEFTDKFGNINPYMSCILRSKQRAMRDGEQDEGADVERSPHEMASDANIAHQSSSSSPQKNFYEEPKRRSSGSNLLHL